MAELIALDLITRNPNQPRETFPTEHIERLAASIKARGLIQPITLRPITRGDTASRSSRANAAIGLTSCSARKTSAPRS
jgi:hypothetical protein